MRFIIKNTLEDGCLMNEETSRWEVSLRNMNGKMQGVLTFEARYITSMSEESYYKLREMFDSKDILGIGTIVISDWEISFIREEKEK